MTTRTKLYEGKAKVLFEGPQPNTVIQYFKDDATAFNAEKKGTVLGKGVLNNYITERIFKGLTDIGIPNHFIERLSDREQLVRKVDIVMVEVIVRNIITGSIVKRLGVEEGTQLDAPLVEVCYKSDEHGAPVISAEHAVAFGWADDYELDQIVEMTLRINDYMRGLFNGLGIKLVDFKLEFGRFEQDGETFIILADEISPDTCRLWDAETMKKLDKDRFRQDLGGVEDAYKEVAFRLNCLPENITGE